MFITRLLLVSLIFLSANCFAVGSGQQQVPFSDTAFSDLDNYLTFCGVYFFLGIISCVLPVIIIFRL
jgi:hypothetical protein